MLESCMGCLLFWKSVIGFLVSYLVRKTELGHFVVCSQSVSQSLTYLPVIHFHFFNCHCSPSVSSSDWCSFNLYIMVFWTGSFLSPRLSSIQPSNYAGNLISIHLYTGSQKSRLPFYLYFSVYHSIYLPIYVSSQPDGK